MPSTNDPVVMIVDDEAEIRDLYTEWLKDGYEVVTASGGESALNRVDETVDILLLDRRMPDTAGGDVANILRE